MPWTIGIGCRPGGVAEGSGLSGRGRELVAGLLWIAALVPAPAMTFAAEPPASGAEPMTPVPAASIPDPAKVRLGERLFHDTRLSHGNAVACASCHDLDEGGDDGLAIASGADGRPLDFNVHFHEGKKVLYPARQNQVARLSGTLNAQVEQDYCWMWTNKGTAETTLRFHLARR